MSVIIIRQPILMFLGALREVAGASAERSIVEEIRSDVEGFLHDRPFDLLEVVVLRTGRSHFVVAYLHPDESVSVDVIDAVRDELQQVYDKRLDSSKSELVLTARQPFEHADDPQ